MSDMEKAKQWLEHLAVAEHMGDANNALPGLCKALDLPEPTWSYERARYVMAWEKP